MQLTQEAQLTPQAQAILEEGYLQPGETSIREIKSRVAKAVAKDHEQEERFTWLFDYFLPNSPALMNAGTALNQLMACFLLPIEDSIEGIAKSLGDMMVIQKSGGGTGFVASELRPEGAHVSTTGGESSGPLSFLSIFDHTMGEIKQGGKRRGASLASIRVSHPDIMQFIQAKQSLEKLTNFNLSVGITNEFMEQVACDGEWLLVDPHTNRGILGQHSAREIWNAIVECAWKTGEPGILFLDRINADNPTPHLGEIEATNPCGEANLLPYEACVLGSINLHTMFDDKGKKGKLVNFDRLEKVARVGVEFLDRVVDASQYPLPEIAAMTKANRKIGIGVMGLGSLLYELGFSYDTPEAAEFAGRLMSIINNVAIQESQRLGKELGAYPEFPKGIHAGGALRRNAAVTSVAPTGTISQIVDVTSGIEPAFALVYRRLIHGKSWRVVDPVFANALRSHGVYSEALLDKVEENRGSCQGIYEVPQRIQDVFVTAHDISPRSHVQMQARIQENVEQSISKTVNLPQDASLGDVEEVLLLAYQQGCKGITVYRDGSRSEQVLSAGPKHKPSERPAVLEGKTSKFATGCGSLYVTLNKDPVGDPHEVFANHSKRSGCVVALLNALASVTSISLRAGVDPEVLAKPLRRQVCHDGGEISSCADAIGITLEGTHEGEGQTCSLEGGCQTCG